MDDGGDELRLKTVDAPDILIDELIIVGRVTLPEYLIPIRQTPLPSNFSSMCQHQSFLYLGRRDGVDKLSLTGSLTGFITFTGSAESISVRNDRMYVLTFVYPQAVMMVYELETGRLYTRWELLPDSTSESSCYCFVDDMIIYPDRMNKRLAVYLDYGRLIKYIFPPRFQNCRWRGIKVCPGGGSSVLISDKNVSIISKLDVETGDVLWMCSEIVQPLLIRYYAEGYVLVPRVENNQTKLQILDVNTG